MKAGVCDRIDDYKYSSYKEYIYNTISLIDKEFTLDKLGTTDFKDFNEEMTNEKCLESDDSKRRLNDKEGQEIIQTILNGRKIKDLITKQEKENLTKELKLQGLSIRQISRLTGIPVGIVRKH